MLGESELVPSVRAPSCHRGSRNVSSPWHRLRAGHLSTVCGQFLKSHSLSMNLLLLQVNPEDVPIMNLVWFGPAALTMICCLLFIRSSDPPSPPRYQNHIS